jgi:hypothetical protein
VKQEVKVLFYQTLPISGRAVLFGRLPSFVRLSFWYEYHVDEDEYGTLLEWH